MAACGPLLIWGLAPLGLRIVVRIGLVRLALVSWGWGPPENLSGCIRSKDLRRAWPILILLGSIVRILLGSIVLILLRLALGVS